MDNNLYRCGSEKSFSSSNPMFSFSLYVAPGGHIVNGGWANADTIMTCYPSKDAKYVKVTTAKYKALVTIGSNITVDANSTKVIAIPKNTDSFTIKFPYAYPPNGQGADTINVNVY